MYSTETIVNGIPGSGIKQQHMLGLLGKVTQLGADKTTLCEIFLWTMNVLLPSEASPLPDLCHRTSCEGYGEHSGHRHLAGYVL